MVEVHSETFFCVALPEKRPNRAPYVRGVLLRGKATLRAALLRSSLRGALEPGVLRARYLSVIKSHFEQFHCAALSLSEKRSNLATYVRGVIFRGLCALREAVLCGFVRKAFPHDALHSRCASPWSRRTYTSSTAQLSPRSASTWRSPLEVLLCGEAPLQEALLRGPLLAALKPCAFCLRCTSLWLRCTSRSSTAQLSPRSAATRRFTFEVYFSVGDSHFEKLCCAALSEERSKLTLYLRGVLVRGRGAPREGLLRSSLRAALQHGALRPRCASSW